MANQEPNMDQFQLPEVYEYQLMLFSSEHEVRPLLFSAYSVRTYSEKELNRISHLIQESICKSEDRDLQPGAILSSPSMRDRPQMPAHRAVRLCRSRK